MNNHKSYIKMENNIEYHVLEYSSNYHTDMNSSTLMNSDSKFLNKIINKYEYVKLIELNATTIFNNPNKNITFLNRVRYYKNGKLHNIYGFADFHLPSLLMFYEYYYLDDIEMSEKQWKNKLRKEKLKKLVFSSHQ